MQEALSTTRGRAARRPVVVVTTHLPPLLEISVRNTLDAHPEILVNPQGSDTYIPVSNERVVTLFNLDTTDPATVRAGERAAPTCTLALTSRMRPDQLRECARNGVRSVVPISITPGDLAREIIRIGDGGPPLMSDRVPVKPRPAGVDSRLLTQREKDILELISMRFSNAEIAGELCLANQTVKNYVSSILRKLGVRSRLDLVQQFAAHPAVKTLDTSAEVRHIHPPLHPSLRQREQASVRQDVGASATRLATPERLS